MRLTLPTLRASGCLVAALLAAPSSPALPGEPSADAGPARGVAVPSAPPPPVMLPPERLTLPGLPNLARVGPGLYRGGRPRLGEGGIESLGKLGVRQVIDLQGGDLHAPSKSGWADWPSLILRLEPGESPEMIQREAEALRAIGAEMISAPFVSVDPITPAEAKTLEQILERLTGASEAQPIYVHCEHGKDRTGLVLALHRMRAFGWSAERAAAEMAEMGHAGYLDELFTGNMDLKRVLALYPQLASAPVPRGPAP